MDAKPQPDLLSGKRMVFASEFQQGGTGQGLAYGFRQLGWAVHEIDQRAYFPKVDGALARGALKALHSSFKKTYNGAITDAARMTRPHVFLTVKGTNIEAATLNALRQAGITTVMMHPDYHFSYPGVDQTTYSAYDLFVTTKSFQVDYLRNALGDRKVALVHHGYCNLVHHPVNQEVEPAIDVLYVGNYSREKAHWLSQLIELIPDVTIRILGFAWNRAEQTNLKGATQGYGLTGDNYARAIQQARINIALHGDRKEPEGWQDLVSTRTFEIPACRGFMLHIDNAEIRSLFEPGREVGVFASVKDLAAQIRHYLARPQERLEMIERAYARCVPAYSYNARAAEIARLIEKA